MVEINEERLHKGFSGFSEREAAEPLTQNTRRERTLLMGANVLLFAMVFAGIVPREITAWGVMADELNTTTVVVLMWFIVLYLGIAFLVSVWADYSAWRATLQRMQIDRKTALTEKARELRGRAQASLEAEEEVELAQIILSDEWQQRWDQHVEEGSKQSVRPYRVRAFYETVIPLLITAANLISTAIDFFSR